MDKADVMCIVTDWKLKREGVSIELKDIRKNT